MTPDLDALQGYLREIALKPFSIGRHDCLTFTNEAYRRMTGQAWAEDWEGKYLRGDNAPHSPRELRSIFGHMTMIDGIDQRMRRVDGIPPRGALIAIRSPRDKVFPHALGICNGTLGAFLSAHGVIYLPITDIEYGWVLPCLK